MFPFTATEASIHEFNIRKDLLRWQKEPFLALFAYTARDGWRGDDQSGRSEWIKVEVAQTRGWEGTEDIENENHRVTEDTKFHGEKRLFLGKGKTNAYGDYIICNT
jgi:hypothetical protein